ncbi:iron/manganese ABC transporter permease subunit SitD, partial [Escherichia coli]|nr:iron/manganese ABC transporter permease subunit SitD [Escherichia coli]MCV8020150.1 iron/manganese ABC transporter permease subunit SitD [Escherichia coli]MCV8074073.1 iron/manganese ABC transporter permease subunit SitD [Escherichia coli]MCV8113614.1 iron/manganese ABC transporter permease subunit SitD [Escherichia coli]MCV8209658.1 iron/manganese ABC transporter permease subunit SitD [Escherichia coli]
RCLHYGLLCMVSLTIVATLKAVGIILSISLLIAPGAIAVLLTQRFHIALLLAIGISVIVSMTGVWLSFFIDSAPAPTIVVLFAVVFIMTFTVTSINARTKGNTHTQDLSSPN